MQNDQELIKEYQNGDRSAFDKIVRRHLSNTIGFFYTITQDRMVSEDLAQDVFFKLFRHLKKFRFKSSFSTYLYRINLNTANSWFTRNKWKSFLSLENADDKGYRDTNVEDEWNRKELWNEISKLPKKQRKVVILRVTDGLSYRDISEITGMSEGTAKVNFHHGLKRLKEKLNND